MEDEREYRRCLKIHGYVCSSEDANDSDDSRRKLDDLYIKFKPPPVEINPDKHKIIVIGNALENRNLTGHHLDKFSQKSVAAVKTTKRKNDVLEVVPNLLVSNRFSVLAVEDTTEDEMGNGSLVNKEELLNENRGIFTINLSAPISEDKGVLADNSKRNNKLLEAVPNLLVSNRFSALAVENTTEDEMGNASLMEKEETLFENHGLFANVSGISEDKGVLADNELSDEDELGLFITVERKFKRKNARHPASDVYRRRKRM